MKYYYKNNLFVIQNRATPGFWDSQWQSGKVGVLGRPHEYSYIELTNKYLPPPAKILEGGCGLAGKVVALQDAGFSVVGIDYAINTVERVKRELPELSIDVGDLSRLPYRDNSFDGYWSFGVIEHFWNGYDELLYEARRVLNEGGFLFLTFPTLSPLRKLKWRLGFYSKLPDIKFSKEDGPQGFYQFFLSHREVCSKLDEIGFDVIDHYFDNVQSGIKQELPRVYRVLSFILRMAPAFVRNKAIALAEELAFFLGHLSVIVAKKKASIRLDQ